VSLAAAATPAAVPAEEAGARIARAVVLGTLLFNFGLAFVNANLARTGAGAVIGAELVLIGVALALIWDRTQAFYAIMAALLGYLIFLMTLRANYDPKVVRDLLIPLVFYFLGSTRGSFESGDKVATAAIVAVAAGALFEWAFLDVYIRFFDVLGYFVAKGTVDPAAAQGVEHGLFISGMRFEGRTLLPFLGEHRVSSVFLEPVSVGNFGAIVFGWVLLRDARRPWALIWKTTLIFVSLVLGDARFGVYLCGLVLAIYLIAPLLRPGALFVAPFLAIIAIFSYAAIKVGVPWDNTTSGRFLLSGQLMSRLDLAGAFGMGPATENFDDSGYAYILSRVGVIGAAALWAVLVFGAPAERMDAWRYKAFVCLYLTLLMAISTSAVTIKTGGLLWFLLGCSAYGATPAPRTMSGGLGAR